MNTCHLHKVTKCLLMPHVAAAGNEVVLFAWLRMALVRSFMLILIFVSFTSPAQTQSNKPDQDSSGLYIALHLGWLHSLRHHTSHHLQAHWRMDRAGGNLFCGHHTDDCWDRRLCCRYGQNLVLDFRINAEKHFCDDYMYLYIRITWHIPLLY